MRRFDEAVAQYRRALETDPLSMMVHFGLAYALYCGRRYDEAIEHAARAVDLYPDYWLVHFGMGLAQARRARCSESIASLEKSRAPFAFLQFGDCLPGSFVRAVGKPRTTPKN